MHAKRATRHCACALKVCANTHTHLKVTVAVAQCDDGIFRSRSTQLEITTFCFVIYVILFEKPSSQKLCPHDLPLCMRWTYVTSGWVKTGRCAVSPQAWYNTLFIGSLKCTLDFCDVYNPIYARMFPWKRCPCVNWDSATVTSVRRTSAPERLAHAFLKGVFLGVFCWRCSQTQTHY